MVSSYIHVEKTNWALDRAVHLRIILLNEITEITLWQYILMIKNTTLIPFKPMPLILSVAPDVMVVGQNDIWYVGQENVKLDCTCGYMVSWNFSFSLNLYFKLNRFDWCLRGQCTRSTWNCAEVNCRRIYFLILFFWNSTSRFLFMLLFLFMYLTVCRI